MLYRKATTEEIPQIYEMVQHTIKTIYPRYYPVEVVNFFCRHHNPEAVYEDVKKGNVSVLIVDDKIVGTGSFLDNHITRVYVLPEHQKKGYGSFIMRNIEAEIFKSYDKVYLDASLPAAILYEKLGYKTIKHEKYLLENDAVLAYEIMEKKEKLVINDDISEYLTVSKYINWDDPAILEKANDFKVTATDEVALTKMIYEYVRDEIRHSWDAQDKRVTKSATDVLEHKVGICWAKSNLLAALLRACSIPAGICYQRLTLGDTPESGFCIHALNAVYLKDLDKWIRLDARGNKEGVDAQFDVEHEKLAFDVRPQIGEVDYKIVYANPSAKLMKVLEENTDALEMYLHALPDTY